MAMTSISMLIANNRTVNCAEIGITLLQGGIMVRIKVAPIIVLLCASVFFFNETYTLAEAQDTNGITVRLEVDSGVNLQELRTIKKKQKFDWNSIIALLTFFAAGAAAISTCISKRNLDEELKPAVVWNAADQIIEEDVTNSKYKAHIKIINYGKGLAYIREISSDSKNIGIHIGTPITLGKNTEGELTLYFEKNKLDNTIKQCQADILISPRGEDITERKMYKLHEFEVELLLKNRSCTLSRNITFDLFYWNIKRECFKTFMDLKIRIHIKNFYDLKNNVDFQCFINNETVDKYKKRNFPPMIIQHESYEDIPDVAVHGGAEAEGAIRSYSNTLPQGRV